MAECNPWDKASQQHMALRQQADSERPAVLVHQHQIALVAVQALEHQRLALIQNQQPEKPQNLPTQIQTQYSTEVN
jgi:hypothetical protein